MRMIALPPGKDNRVQAALQIEPKAGWITYWREPGDAGIPPRVTPKQPGNMSVQSMDFPAPRKLDAGGLQDIGYDGPVTLYLQFSPDDAKISPRIDTNVFIGLCKNICVPFQADFSLDPAAPDLDPEQARQIVDSARKSLPEKASEDFRVTGYRFVRHEGETPPATLHVELRLPAEAPLNAQFFVTGPEDHAFTTVAQQVRNGRSMTIEMPIDRLPEGYVPEENTWRILTVAGDRAMETGLDLSRTTGHSPK